MGNAIIPGNGVDSIGESGTPWATGFFTALQKGGQDVVVTNDARLPVADEKAAMAGTSGTPSTTNRFITAADRGRLWALPDVVGMTGGGSTKLDGYVTSGVTVGLVVCFVDANGGTPLWRAYQLTAGTTAESSPNVIRPDDYATTTNEKVWKLVSAATSADALAVAFDPDNYTPAGTSLAQHLEAIDTVLGSVLISRTGTFRVLSKSPHEMIANTGTPTVGSLTIGSMKVQAVTLPNDATKSVQMVFRLPDEWDDATSPKLKLEWAGADTGNVRWETAITLFDSGDDLTGSLGTATAFEDTTAAADELVISPATQPTPAGAGRFALVEVSRIGAHAGDTLAGNVYLLGVRMQIEESATEPTAWT